jgi:putative endonuclease
MKEYWVYITSNKNRTVFYVGMTNNLARRIGEHKGRKTPSFTKRYNVDELLYYEAFPTPLQAIKREKQLKTWHRQWKLELIKEFNADMKDLYDEIT